MPIIKQRMTAVVEGDFCVFVIGMRVNSWLRVHKWWPVAIAMPRMIKELKAAPEPGFLGAEQALGNPTIMIQYWRSFEQLEPYARRTLMTALSAPVFVVRRSRARCVRRGRRRRWRSRRGLATRRAPTARAGADRGGRGRCRLRRRRARPLFRA